VGKVTLLIVLVALLFGAGSIAGYVIEFQWWKEMNQTETWFAMLWYSLAPVAVATLLAFVALLAAHARSRHTVKLVVNGAIERIKRAAVSRPGGLKKASYIPVCHWCGPETNSDEPVRRDSTHEQVSGSL